MKGKNILLYTHADLRDEYADLSIEKITLRHIITTALSELHPKGMVAYTDNKTVKILIRKGTMPINSEIISTEKFAELVTEEFL